MRESLHIRHFGPIEEVDLLSLGRINIFIGESGSGKSTVLKLLAVCRWLYKMSCLRTYFHNSNMERSPFRFRIESILQSSGLWEYRRADNEVVYVNGGFSVVYANGKLSFSPKYVPDDELSLEKIAFISDKRVVIPDLSEGNISVRHGMYYLNDTFQNFKLAVEQIKASASLPYLGLRMETRKTNIGRRLYVTGIGDDNRQYSIPLTQASSGVQSAVAVQLIVDYFACHYDLIKAMNSTVLGFLSSTDSLAEFKASTNVGAFPRRRISISVEEPEINLFPSNQKGLIEHLVGACMRPNDSGVELNLSMATHSPYVLATVNMLMLADKAIQMDPGRTKAIIGSETTTIPFNKVAAWEIRDGRAKSLMDSETEMIDGVWLDSVSDIVQDQICALNDIVYG